MKMYAVEDYERQIDVKKFLCTLTKKQYDVVACLLFENSYKSIGETLHISNRTVEAHLQEICKAKRIATSQQDLWIAIDDFGTGLNNMDVVDMYHTKIVKVDRQLISGIDHLPEKQENVKKIVDEIHSKGILALAEGVEEKEEFDYLVKLHFDLFQGYYLGRPE